MVYLKDIENIATNIKVAKASLIKTFHNLIFENTGDRANRKRIRDFSGFIFKKDSNEHKSKLTFINNNFSAGDLVSICNMLCIDHTGDKDDLIDRICACLTDIEGLKGNIQETEDEDEETDDDSENDEDGKSYKDANEDKDEVNENRYDSNKDGAKRRVMMRKQSTSTTNRANDYSNQPMALSISFRDVEDSVRKFDGSSEYPIEKWIDDVEELSQLLNWNDLHTFIFAKKLLIGLAKLFVQGESGIKSWKQLKSALQQEFSKKINSAQLHRNLSERKMNRNETMQEYFLTMKEMAVRGNIEESALIQYIVDGICDDMNSKMILYNANNLHDLKEKLRIHEEVNTRSQHMSKNQHIKVNTKRSDPDKKTESRANVLCFNCGAHGHKSIDCSSRSKGAKCFKCNRFGHRFFELPKYNEKFDELSEEEVRSRLKE